MAEPQLTILGIYRPVVSAETWQEQFEVTEDKDETTEHFAKLVLIEALVENLDEPFDMAKFGQMSAEAPDDPQRMQVGYDECLLSSDGESLVERNMDCVHGSGSLRFAVYLHLYDPDRPLLWQKGEIAAQLTQEVPVRLAMLMPYNACS